MTERWQRSLRTRWRLRGGIRQATARAKERTHCPPWPAECSLSAILGRLAEEGDLVDVCMSQEPLVSQEHLSHLLVLLLGAPFNTSTRWYRCRHCRHQQHAKLLVLDLDAEGRMPAWDSRTPVLELVEGNRASSACNLATPAHNKQLVLAVAPELIAHVSRLKWSH